jgi:hypothetical protein
MMTKLQVNMNKWFWRLSLGIIGAGLLVSSLNIIGCALFIRFRLLKCVPESLDYWQLLISLLAVPAVGYQLYSLNKTIREQQAAPKIRIGLAQHPFDKSDLTIDQPFPTSLLKAQPSNGENYYCNLVIQNHGNRVAKFVKIIVELQLPENGADGLERPSFKSVGTTNSNLNIFYSDSSARYTFIFRGAANWHVYPHDIEFFTIELWPRASGGRSPKDRRHWNYSDATCKFRCTVWADGLDEPISQDLELHYSFKKT